MFFISLKLSSNFFMIIELFIYKSYSKIMEYRTFTLLKKGLTTSDLSLLSEVINVYGYKFSASYRHIGEKTNMTYITVR